MTGKTPRASEANGVAVCGGARLAYRISEFSAASGIGRSLIYEAIAAGRLRARKLGKITLIDAVEARRFVECLPFVEPAGAATAGDDTAPAGRHAPAGG